MLGLFIVKIKDKRKNKIKKMAIHVISIILIGIVVSLTAASIRYAVNEFAREVHESQSNN
jgi:hypothetical protein